MRVNNGGYAFPLTTVSNGMTLRDYFAAKAMQGLLAEDYWSDHDDVSKIAYKIADAMIEAREAT
jgi:hypothetical protein